MEDNNQFLQQMAGSSVANILTVALFMIYKFIEGRCKHSQCQSNTSLCSCKADNYETKRDSKNPYNKDDIQPEIRLQKLHRSELPQVHERHPQTSQADSSSSSENSRDSRLAKRGEIV